MRFILEDEREELNLYLTMRGLKPASTIDARSYIKGIEFYYGFRGLGRLCSSLLEKRLRKMNVPFVNEGKCSFLIGSNEKNLERLVKAKGAFETGIALGYPEDAIEWHCSPQRRYGTEAVNLAKARDAGIKVPSWMAYLSFAMGDFDIEQNRFPETGKQLGTRYRDFTRENYPRLARRVEKEFSKGKLLPEEWELLENGDYKQIRYIPRRNKRHLILED